MRHANRAEDGNGQICGAARRPQITTVAAAPLLLGGSPRTAPHLPSPHPVPATAPQRTPDGLTSKNVPQIYWTVRRVTGLADMAAMRQDAITGDPHYPGVESLNPALATTRPASAPLARVEVAVRRKHEQARLPAIHFERLTDLVRLAVQKP